MSSKNALNAFGFMLRIIITYVLIFISVLLFIFLAYKTRLPTKPLFRFNNTLVDQYIKSNNLNYRHYIEKSLDLNYLSPSHKQKFIAHFWSNYSTSPEEYWRNGSSDVLKSVFFEISKELYHVLINRREYRLDHENISTYFEKIFAKNPYRFCSLLPVASRRSILGALSSFASEIEQNADSLGRHNNVEELPNYMDLYSGLDRFRKASQYQNTYMMRFVISFSPIYQIIVYDSILRAADLQEAYSGLIDISKEILANKEGKRSRGQSMVF